MIGFSDSRQNLTQRSKHFKETAHDYFEFAALRTEARSQALHNETYIGSDLQRIDEGPT